MPVYILSTISEKYTLPQENKNDVTASLHFVAFEKTIEPLNENLF